MGQLKLAKVVVLIDKGIKGILKGYAKFKYTETEEMQAIELPYEGEELSMLVLIGKDTQ
ncbi:MAG: hypothetical protein ACPLSJ_01815 [Thermosulfidibacteraceae bacterium]